MNEQNSFLPIYGWIYFWKDGKWKKLNKLVWRIKVINKNTSVKKVSRNETFSSAKFHFLVPRLSSTHSREQILAQESIVQAGFIIFPQMVLLKVEQKILD